MKKFLLNPVRRQIIHQKFGENLACIPNESTSNKIILCDGHNPPDGYRSVYSRMKGHNGLDLHATSWEPCYAAQTGVIAEVSTEEDRGLGVGIITQEKYFCPETGKQEHFKIRNWHFWANSVEVGQKVKVGDLIGYCGSTGYSTGVHLHLEIKPVNVTWREDGSIRRFSNILQSNGYFGAVDPLPHLDKINAIQFAGLWRQVKELSARTADFLADLARK